MISGISREGDLASLFREHGTALFRLGIALTGDRALAEELVQDAFVALARQPRSPRPGTELAYLRRSVVNASHDHHRHLSVIRRHPNRRPDDHPAAEESAARRESQRRVAEAVRALPTRQRDCMVLRCYAESTDVEIAEILGIGIGSVKTHLHRARTRLAETLEDLR